MSQRAFQEDQKLKNISIFDGGWKFLLIYKSACKKGLEGLLTMVDYLYNGSSK